MECRRCFDWKVLRLHAGWLIADFRVHNWINKIKGSKMQFAHRTQLPWDADFRHIQVLRILMGQLHEWKEKKVSISPVLVFLHCILTDAEIHSHMHEATLIAVNSHSSVSCLIEPGLHKLQTDLGLRQLWSRQSLNPDKMYHCRPLSPL